MVLDFGSFNATDTWSNISSWATPVLSGSLKIGGVILVLCWTLLLSAIGTVIYAIRQLIKTNSLQLALIALIKTGAKVIAVHIALLVAAVLFIVSDVSGWYIIGGAVVLALLLSVVLGRTIGYVVAWKFRKYLQWFAILRKGKDVYAEINQNRR
jgi:phage-related minor tail protein